ncbi:Uncharacterised protein [Yersinia pseudotuberculosis]|uniref:Uncharacterized protein n=1 Tax=Yersinia pseudotuberculosis TaxID=633 RepID=A0A380SBG7_YERPU|nr:Uncharacterised protein [Yersinia pseudotuberculosis]
MNNNTGILEQQIIDQLGVRLGNGKYCTLRVNFNHVGV